MINRRNLLAGALLTPTFANAQTPLKIDTHAHIFLRSLPMVANRRYTPDYDVSLKNYLDVLTANQMTGGVLVQPSFFGTDNSYIETSLKTNKNLRGIAVVDPSVSDEELLRLHKAGFVGVRFNLIGDDPKKLASPNFQSLCKRVAKLKWQIEIQAKSADWGFIIDSLKAIDTSIVADHYGLPEPKLSDALVSEGKNGRIHVKLSAHYRSQKANHIEVTRALLEKITANRLVWGSDWPWTQHEAGKDYAALYSYVENNIGEKNMANINKTAKRLFKF